MVAENFCWFLFWGLRLYEEFSNYFPYLEDNCNASSLFDTKSSEWATWNTQLNRNQASWLEIEFRRTCCWNHLLKIHFTLSGKLFQFFEFFLGKMRFNNDKLLSFLVLVPKLRQTNPPEIFMFLSAAHLSNFVKSLKESLKDNLCWFSFQLFLLLCFQLEFKSCLHLFKNFSLYLLAHIQFPNHNLFDFPNWKFHWKFHIITLQECSFELWFSQFCMIFVPRRKLIIIEAKIDAT